jgi:glutamine synthetase
MDVLLLKMMIMIFGLDSNRNISFGILRQINLLVFQYGGFPGPQGPYYCGVGAANAFGRPIVEEHLDACLDAGLNVEGINAEVASGQVGVQIFSKGAKEAGDQVWIARYLLERIGEKIWSIC